VIEKSRHRTQAHPPRDPNRDGQGESYPQIVDRLSLAPHTVRAHLATIYRKLGVSSKLERRDRSIPAAITLNDVPTEHATRPDRPSIAVMAFENMSGDPEEE
jgi:DNA-binding NarL/FixJ family response regulator